MSIPGFLVFQERMSVRGRVVVYGLDVQTSIYIDLMHDIDVSCIRLALRQGK